VSEVVTHRQRSAVDVTQARSHCCSMKEHMTQEYAK